MISKFLITVSNVYSNHILTAFQKNEAGVNPLTILRGLNIVIIPQAIRFCGCGSLQIIASNMLTDPI
jgi:hypothetical protein